MTNGHRIREITSRALVGGWISLVCECGWYKRMSRLHDVLAAHDRHRDLALKILTLRHVN